LIAVLSTDFSIFSLQYSSGINSEFLIATDSDFLYDKLLSAVSNFSVHVAFIIQSILAFAFSSLLSSRSNRFCNLDISLLIHSILEFESLTCVNLASQNHLISLSSKAFILSLSSASTSIKSSFSTQYCSQIV
jgi:hypothetical protein